MSATPKSLADVGTATYPGHDDAQYRNERTAMLSNVTCFRWLALVGVVCAGCSQTAPAPTPTPTPPPKTSTDQEPVLRAKFAELQAAVKAKDTGRIWALLSDKSKTEADRIAKDVQAAYAKADAKEKAALEDALGMKAAEIEKLTGQGYLKSKRFEKKHDELPESKIEKVVMQEEGGVVHFLEPDGDHEKLTLVREDGQWKIWLGIPKIRKVPD